MGAGSIHNFHNVSHTIMSSESAKILAEVISTSLQGQAPTVLEKQKVASEIFRNILIGIGALLGGISGLNILQEWIRKRKAEINKNGLKRKYSTKKLGEKFDLVWFSGKLILFDHDEMSYFHVYPWETAEDLGFVSFGKKVKDSFPNPEIKKIKIGKKTLDTSTYKNGGVLNTRNWTF